MLLCHLRKIRVRNFPENLKTEKLKNILYAPKKFKFFLKLTKRKIEFAQTCVKVQDD